MQKICQMKRLLNVSRYRPSLSSASAQPCSSWAANNFDPEMCVDEIDESEDKNNEVLVEADDDSDTD